MSKIIGIDLGTTNSVVAAMEGGQPVVVPNAQGGRTTPSAVAFTESGDELVGLSARRQAVMNPLNTVFSIKRFMGRRGAEAAKEARLVPYKIEAAADAPVEVDIRGKRWTPPEISAKILRVLKESAENYFGKKIERAVITVPAYFNDAQRQATKDAGAIAGLEVVRIINEPTAAALAYGLERSASGKIAIFDLGGGTFDISILDVEAADDDPEMGKTFEVLATNGDTYLGGDDFDAAIVQWMVQEFKSENGFDVAGDKMAFQRLKEAAEKAKCELSFAAETDVNLPFLSATKEGPVHFQRTLSRTRMEQLIRPLLERLRGPCRQALADAGLSTDAVTEVILVGGSTRMPCVQNTAREIFGREPNKSVNPDEVVAIGAAIQGGILAGERTDVVLLDVTPLSLGIETWGGVMTKIVERNTTIPVKKTMPFSTVEDGQTKVDIHVLQGEREMAVDNRSLATFELTGVKAAPRGVPKIEVSFDIDANGILHVSARDVATGREQLVRVTASGGLTRDDVDRMKKDAEAHAAEDKARRESIELRNKAEVLVYEVAKGLEAHAGELSEVEAAAIRGAKDRLIETMKQADGGALEAAYDELVRASHRLSQLSRPGDS